MTALTSTFLGSAVTSKVAPKVPKRDVRTNAIAKGAKPRAGQTYKNLQEAVDAGLVKGCAPFPNGIDAFGFFNDIDQAEAQRYADVEITHGRLAMWATVGFLVGESVEGSSFLFDAQVTGPAVNHFQQVPTAFWLGIGATIFACEAARVQIAWQNPFDASRLFLMKDDHIPGDYGEFDPLGFREFRGPDRFEDDRMRELNNGRLAMVSIFAMVAQELNTGLNLILSDEVLEMAGGGSLKAMEIQCAGAADENACAKAFEASVNAARIAADAF